jgi:predicted dehydrogenase
MRQAPLRWGILSTANIGLKAVIPALVKATNCEVVALASRGLARAQEAAAGLGIPTAYGSYGALLEDDRVDAVYNPLPNSLHKPWTLRALAAGKHVLCEKPLGLDAAECLELKGAAERAGVTLMEAFMYRFHPRTEKLFELVRGGAVGELRLIRTAFSFRLTDEANIRLDPELGGGALYDVGCYCVNVIRSLSGEEPLLAQALARWTGGGLGEGVDEQLVGTLSFPSGLLAQFDCALSLERREFLEVVGTDGRLEVEGTFVVGQEDVVIAEKHGGREDIVHPTRGADKYQKMVEHFADCVLHDKPLRYGLDDAVANMRAIDALYRSAKNRGLPQALADERYSEHEREKM